MTKPAEFRGRFAGLVLDRDRRLAVVTIELPIAEGGPLLDVFGRPDGGAPVALTRPAEGPTGSAEPPSDMLADFNDAFRRNFGK